MASPADKVGSASPYSILLVGVRRRVRTTL
jgi:hypothetical protein